MDGPNNLECLVLVKFFLPILMFAGKAMSLPWVEHLKPGTLIGVYSKESLLKGKDQNKPEHSTFLY